MTEANPMPIDRRQTAGRYTTAVVLGCVVLGPRPAFSQERPSLEADTRRQTSAVVQRGIEFLVAAQQTDGGWMQQGRTDPAITALAIKSIAQSPRYGPTHSSVRRGLKFILSYVHADGGIYVDGLGLRNYYTSVCLMALAAVGDPPHGEAIANAQQFLKRLQWDEGEDHDRTSSWYGGTGYGRQKRPDLSNTQMMLEALKQSGLPSTDPVYRKALTFITRCQMASEVNDQPFVGAGGDGGFIYTPANGGESKAGTEIVEGKPRLRTYGSMTYAGFKSLLHADVDRNDPRVLRALSWIWSHYTLDHNPNMPNARSGEGLYYYYHVFAKALQAWGEEKIVDPHGGVHHWQTDLCRKLIELQRPDGSWSNDADRWYEGNPYLVTSYAILTLQTAMEPPKKVPPPV